MAERDLSSRAKGFSMAEMLVALVFVLVLMAGLASVFKASLSTFYTSGESLSSVRRNRMSVDLLANDLDSACMYLANLSNTPSGLVAGNPPFCVLPNMLFTGPSSVVANRCDELYFYTDQILPFDGTLTDGTKERSNSQIVAAGPVATTSADKTFAIECHNASNAGAVAKGQYLIFKDQNETAFIATTPTLSTGDAYNSVATFSIGMDAKAGLLGIGATGTLQNSHLSHSQVVFFRPAQVIKYSVQLLKLDPAAGAPLVPCLVRDQGDYSAQSANYAGFVTNQAQQIITENVQGFKVYLSASSPSPLTPSKAQAWAGSNLADTDTGWAGWTGGLLSANTLSLDTQVAAVFPNTTLPSVTTDWFRNIPLLVRVDLTTRTATQRSEYSKAPLTLAYKTQTQSLVFVPRHSGLPMDPS